MNYNLLMSLTWMALGIGFMLFHRKKHSWGLQDAALVERLRSHPLARYGWPCMLILSLLYLLKFTSE